MLVAQPRAVRFLGCSARLDPFDVPVPLAVEELVAQLLAGRYPNLARVVLDRADERVLGAGGEVVEGLLDLGLDVLGNVRTPVLEPEGSLRVEELELPGDEVAVLDRLELVDVVLVEIPDRRDQRVLPALLTVGPELADRQRVALRLTTSR